MPPSRRCRTPGCGPCSAYGFPWWGKWDERQPSWFVRAATEHFSTQDQLLTLALAAPGPGVHRLRGDPRSLEAGPRGRGTDLDPRRRRFLRSRRQVRAVREGRRARSRHHLHPLHDAQRHRDPDDRGHRRNRVAGGSGRDDDGPRHAADPEVSRPRPEAEPQHRRGDQRPRATCSTRCDRCSPCSARWRRVRARRRSPLATCSEYATIEGARANGLDAKVGSLTPGKQADIIMLRTDRMNVTPLNDPATAVVTSMDTGNVDTVMIGGRVMKQGGRSCSTSIGRRYAASPPIPAISSSPSRASSRRRSSPPPRSGHSASQTADLVTHVLDIEVWVRG